MNFKELRKDMIVLSNTVPLLKPSRPLSLVLTHLQTAMMWTGTYMKFAKLGDNPYAKHDGNRKTIADIEPMFDNTEKTLDKEFIKAGTIVTADQMRVYLEKQSDALIQYIASGSDGKLMIDNHISPEDVMQASMSLFNIHKHLMEAKMWLGMELGRIRDLREGELNKTE